MWPNRFSTPPAVPVDPLVADVLLSLRDHPIAQEAVERAFQARQSERRRHADEIERLQAEELRGVGERREQAARAANALDAARAAVEKAERDDFAARAAVAQASSRYSLAIGRHRSAIIAQAEPQLEAFIEEMLALIQLERGRVNEQSNTGRVEDAISGAVERARTTNALSTGRRHEAIRDAIREAREMQEAADQSGIAERLAQLRDTFPKIETEIVGLPMKPTVHLPPAPPRYTAGRAPNLREPRPPESRWNGTLP